MSDNKIVKTLPDVTTITGLVAEYGCIAKKVVKEPTTSDRKIHGHPGWISGD